MRREAVSNTLFAFAVFFLAVGPTRSNCQSAESRADETQNTDRRANSSSNTKPLDVPTISQKEQHAEDKTPEKPAKGKTHVRLGTVTVGASYTRFSDNFFVSPFWAYGFYPYYFGYAPFFYDPSYRSYFFEPYAAGFAYGPDKGEVRLDAKPSSASVYLNDAYAGSAGKLKHIWLEPGAYDLTVAAADGSEFHQRIYVLSGKSLKIHARIIAQGE